MSRSISKIRDIVKFTVSYLVLLQDLQRISDAARELRSNETHA